MRVEQYSSKYYSDVLKIIENFYNEAVIEYDNGFDVKAVAETINSADPQNTFLLIIDGICQGILYGTRFKSRINDNQIFQEVIWYVNAPFRRYGGVWLLKEVEKLLKSNGVSIIIMAVLENSKTEKLKSFYQRLGFKPMETHFVRVL